MPNENGSCGAVFKPDLYRLTNTQGDETDETHATKNMLRCYVVYFFLQMSRVAESICSLPLKASIFMNGTDCKQNFTITTPEVTFEALSILPLSLHAEGRIVRTIVFVK